MACGRKVVACVGMAATLTWPVSGSARLLIWRCTTP
ncbi:Uncharacterised protein [Bordetella pertussis]|nr:Uncharacterised protein [Bordetella pertussis]